jgi:hypothetical protein
MKNKSMNKLISCGLFLAFITLFFSCKYTCDGFPEGELKWIPFKLGDTLTYVSSVDTLQFEITDLDISKSSRSYGLSMDFECYNHASYSTNTLNGIMIREFIWFSDEFMVEFSEDDLFEYPGLKEMPQNMKVTVDVLNDTIINGYKYSRAYKYTKEMKSEDESIQWVIKAEDHGIISFYDSKKDITWLKISKHAP